MKHYLPLVLAICILSACAGSRNYLAADNPELALMDAVEQLKIKPKDKKAMEAIPVLYKEITNNYLASIKKLQTSDDDKKWEKILEKYKILLTVNDLIQKNNISPDLLSPTNYTASVLDAKAEAAVNYYELAEAFDITESKDKARKAYLYYKKVNEYFPAYGYKSSRSQMLKAFDAAVVNIIINPLHDSSYSSLQEWHNNLYDYSNKYFQKYLAQDLQSIEQDLPANFYTQEEASKNNVQPDWIIDLTIKDLYLPEPESRTSQYQIENTVRYVDALGTDSTGTRVNYETSFETTSATAYHTFQFVSAVASIEVNVKNVNTLRNIAYQSFRDGFRWSNQFSYNTGDARALAPINTFAGIASRSSADGFFEPTMLLPMNNIENYYSDPPNKQQALEEVYKKIYFKVRSKIVNTLE